MQNGGMCVGYSDVHYGHARNLIQPGRADVMADGWETARKVFLQLVTSIYKWMLLGKQ